MTSKAELKEVKTVYLPWTPTPETFKVVTDAGYVPVYDKVKPPYFLNVDAWINFRQLSTRTKEPKNWNLGGQSGRNQRTIAVRKEDGQVMSIALDKVSDAGDDWTKFWDAEANKALDLARTMKETMESDKSKYAQWQVVEYNGQAAQPPLSGVYEKKDITDEAQKVVDTKLSDTRTFGPAVGYGFSLKIPEGSGNTKPIKDADYVRLRKSKQGKEIMANDSAAINRGLNSGAILIQRETMIMLADGTYKWADNRNSVYCCNDKCQITWFTCPKPLQSEKWWTDAFRLGTSVEQSFGSRSRDVKGLNLLFVIPENNDGRVDKVSLEKTIETAKKESKLVLGTTAIVVDEINSTASKQEYSWYLSTSPFGDYETWIRPADYISYLQNYSGYRPPNATNMQTLIAGIQKLQPSKDAKEKTEKWDETRRRQTTNLSPAGLLTNPIDNFSICKVSYETISMARGERKSFPGQASQMAGSSTEIAKALGWETGGRVTSLIDSSRTPALEWDAPGTYTSEWLHRIAWSWGSEGTPGMNQSSSNFIFGSSEANSLMTRYEKAWQSLFYKEAQFNAEWEKVGQKLSSADKLVGGVLTAKTFTDELLVHHEVDDKANPTKICTFNTKRSNDGKTNIEKVETLANGTVSRFSNDPTFADVDYWNIALQQRNLSFCLSFILALNKTSAIGISDVPKTRFYPFQRGFFTRL